MLSKVFAGAILAAAFSATLVGAQSIAQLGGPANYPPAGFTGQQYADARGCIFLRAGFGKSVNWVPRVSRNRKPICGFPPTFGAQVAAAVQADMAPEAPAPGSTAPARATAVVPAPTPAPGPTIYAKPAQPTTTPAPQATSAARAAMAAPSPAPGPTVFASAAPNSPATPAAPRRGYGLGLLFGTGQPSPAPSAQIVAAPVPVAMVAPAAGYQTTRAAAPAVQCFKSAPRLERVLLRSGGTADVCTRGDGTTTGWRPPVYAAGNGVGAALGNPTLNAQTMAGAVVIGTYATTTTPVAAAAPPIVVARNTIPTPPRGYKLAWKDGRLNPLRGVGTAAGQAAQDQVWTRDVPAVLVAAAPQTSVAPALRTSVSTMSAPQAPASGSAAAYVQIGTFGQPANASAAAARLTALGLPVSTARITRSGKALQIVYAGPFGTATAAQAALSAVRGAGFGDAFLK